MELIKQGAEARIFKFDGFIIKQRFLKKYRIRDLDVKLTHKRILQEVKQIQRLKFVKTPTVYLVDMENYTIYMEYIEGVTCKDYFGTKEEIFPTGGPAVKSITLIRLQIAEKIGKELAMIHDQDCIHGDLTTSNIIVKRGELYWIDFGLSYMSNLPEDKAVDLYVLERAIESTHSFMKDQLFDAILEAYQKQSVNQKTVLARFEQVRARGRKRSQLG